MYKTLFFLGLAFQLSAANPEQGQKNPQIVVEPDQTDIYAIPLDEDAQEQQEELYELEHPNKSSVKKSEKP